MPAPVIDPQLPEPCAPRRSWFTATTPPGDLGEELMTVWRGHVEGYRTALPDGCPGIVWIEPGELWFCAPATTTMRFWRPAGREVVGVAFRPGAVQRVLRADVLTPTRAKHFHPLVDVLDADTVQHVGATIRAARDPLDGLIDAISPFVEDAKQPTLDEELLTEALAAPFVPPIAELAANLAMSARQLHRVGVAIYGFAPTTLARIIRLQRFLRVGRARPEASIAELAAEAGYYDHSHLCREARAIALLSPTEVLARFDSTLPDHDEPYTPPRRRSAAS